MSTGRKITIIVSGVVAVSGISFMIYNRIRKRAMIQRIEEIIVAESKAVTDSSTSSTSDIASGVGSAAWNRSVLPVAKVTEYGKLIYDSKGWTYDNEDAIYSTIAKLKNKIQVSQVNQYIQSRNGGVDMILWLQQFVDKKGPSGELYMDMIINHISKLPKTS